MKVNISLDENLVKRIDGYAETNYLTRSGLISMACVQYLNSSEMVLAIKDMGLAMRKIADTGNLDSETMEMLEDFERVCRVFTGK